MGEVVAAGWAGIRPGGIPTCRLCHTKFPRPSAVENTVLLQLYKAKYNTIEEMAAKTDPPKKPRQQPVPRAKPNSQPPGSGPRGEQSTAAPWAHRKDKEVAKLRQQVKELRESNDKLVAGQGEHTETSTEAAGSDDGDQEKQLRQRIANIKKWIKEADTPDEKESFQAKLEAAEKDLQAVKERRDANKPPWLQAKEAEQASKAAQTCLEFAKTKLQNTKEALQQLQREHDEEAKKVDDLQAKYDEAAAKASKLAAQLVPTSAAPALQAPPRPQQQVQVYADLQQRLGQHLSEEGKKILAQRHTEAQQQSETEGMVSAVAADTDDVDVDMDDPYLDSLYEEFTGQSNEGATTEELQDRRSRTKAIAIKKGLGRKVLTHTKVKGGGQLAKAAGKPSNH